MVTVLFFESSEKAAKHMRIFGIHIMRPESLGYGKHAQLNHRWQWVICRDPWVTDVIHGSTDPDPHGRMTHDPYLHFPSLNTPFAPSSKRGFSNSIFRTSSSDTDCFLTFSLTSSARPHQSKISESTSTPTSACDAMFRKPSSAASLFFASCAVSDDQFRRPCTRRSLSPSSCHDWITAMLCWSACQDTCTAGYSRCLMLLHFPSLACDSRTISLTHSPVSTGWKPPSVSWRRLCIGHWMAQHHPVWLQTSDGCLTCRSGDVCGHHWPISWTSASRSVQLLETKRLLLPVLGCVTVW